MTRLTKLIYLDHHAGFFNGASQIHVSRKQALPASASLCFRQLAEKSVVGKLPTTSGKLPALPRIPIVHAQRALHAAGCKLSTIAALASAGASPSGCSPLCGDAPPKCRAA